MILYALVHVLQTTFSRLSRGRSKEACSQAIEVIGYIQLKSQVNALNNYFDNVN